MIDIKKNEDNSYLIAGPILFLSMHVSGPGEWIASPVADFRPTKAVPDELAEAYKDLGWLTIIKSATSLTVDRMNRMEEGVEGLDSEKVQAAIDVFEKIAVHAAVDMKKKFHEFQGSSILNEINDILNGTDSSGASEED